jgi:hypothetical protein
MRALLALFVVASVASPALADLAPPPGYVEKCTVENHQKDGRTCTSCAADFKRRDRCELELGVKGYTRACRTRGASVWSEVWCLDAKPAPTPSEPAPTPAEPVPAPVEPPAPPAPAPEQNTPAPEVKAADVQPKRDGKCNAGGLATALPLVLALGSLGVLAARTRRRS